MKLPRRRLHLFRSQQVLVVQHVINVFWCSCYRYFCSHYSYQGVHLVCCPRVPTVSVLLLIFCKILTCQNNELSSTVLDFPLSVLNLDPNIFQICYYHYVYHLYATAKIVIGPKAHFLKYRLNFFVVVLHKPSGSPAYQIGKSSWHLKFYADKFSI